jgi:antitoxin HicB
MKTKSIEEYLKEPYARVLIPEAEGGFSCEVLELPGCYAQGDTASEALNNLDDAIAVWIEAALAQGQTIPEAFANYETSGKVALRLPRSTHQKAIQMAQLENMSLNTFIVGAVEARVAVTGYTYELMQRLENRLVAKTAANVMARFLPMIKDWDETAIAAAQTRWASTPATPIVVNNFVEVR